METTIVTEKTISITKPIQFEEWKTTVDLAYVLICVVGDHSGENADNFFTRKIRDTKTVGFTIWYMGSVNAKPEVVQKFAKEAASKGKSAWMLFLDGGSGARPTTIADVATLYSADDNEWKDIPKGKMSGKPYSVVLDTMFLAEGTVDLWDFAKYTPDDTEVHPLKWSIGGSTMCAIAKDTSKLDGKMKSHSRKLAAIGRLVAPYGAWLKCPNPTVITKKKREKETTKKEDDDTKKKKAKKEVQKNKEVKKKTQGTKKRKA